MQLHGKLEINASADEAWKILGEGFGTISDWTSSLEDSSLNGELKVGCVRTCLSSKNFGPFKGGIAKERLVAYDTSLMMFEYKAISGLPGFVRKASNRWSIHKVDEENCIVRFNATLDLRGIFKLMEPIMKLLVKKDLNKFKNEICYRIENGRPHLDACT